MTGRVDYQIEKYLLTEAAEPERLTRQWAEVLEECREQQSGAEDRLRLALLNVDLRLPASSCPSGCFSPAPPS